MSNENSSLLAEDELVSLLPSYPVSETLLVGDQLPCHHAGIKSQPMKAILTMLQRKVWVEGLYVHKKDLQKINRYKHPDGKYKHDFDEQQFHAWIKHVEENTAVCKMENKKVGLGVFVPPGKKLCKGTFIPSSGIIKLAPTIEEMETKVHCSALQDLNSHTRKIVGLIDPAIRGGILDLINHAPDKEELANFNFKNSAIKNRVATANLTSVIKFYHGYAIMGVETLDNIHGNEFGKQLLWSYARACEYNENDQQYLNTKILLLFNGQDQYNGETINTNNYSLREINIFVDTGEIIVKKAASLTRWEIMESSPERGLTLLIEDPFSSNQYEAIPSSITYGFLQTYLKENPLANRIIIKIPALAAGNKSY